ncbi:MAG: tRNA pseudouridine(38-40) synthase TruA [Bacteroidales bacterium]
MKRYFIRLAFKGTIYHGWQIQDNDITVQEVLNKSFSTLLRENINVVGAGRTDTGVHASCFYAHFDSENMQFENKDHFLFKINNFLPKDIAIYNISPVTEKAHSRYSAESRTYKYFINKIKNPFKTDFSYHLFYKLDVEIMNKACNLLYEYSDFTSFSKKNTQVKTNLCEIYHASWQENDEEIIFTIQANRFLRNMVRAIVGTMIDIGRGNTDIEEFRKIIESRNRCKAGYSVPPNGLFLTGISYPSSIFLNV